MLKLITELAISIYLTSTLFMLFFYFNAMIVTYRREKRILKMPLPMFLYVHFCPIVHTKKCIQILIRFYAMKQQRRV